VPLAFAAMAFLAFEATWSAKDFLVRRLRIVLTIALFTVLLCIFFLLGWGNVWEAFTKFLTLIK
jgi:hypothetical protein